MVEEGVQRRLTTILAADVAGYSRLMGADEEGTLAALRSHRSELIDPKIAQYDGRIANTAGDSILAEFPSVVEALRCAMEIQDAMEARNGSVAADQRILLRMGLNVGDVIEQDGDLFGDGVNIAARLEALATPGGICVSRAVRDQVRDRMDIALTDLGEVEVKNIARPVRVFRVSETGASENPVPTGISPRRRLVPAALAVAILLAGAGFLLWQTWPGGESALQQESAAHQLPDKPSVAILPFANLSGDEKDDYFADGFTEDLITNVAQTKELFVIARNSTFTYKGRAVAVPQVARELGVRYVVEGSVRRIADKIRITAQLIDATDGTHVWAKRYDQPRARIFDVQDELSREIAGRLLANISKADLAKIAQKRPKDLSVYELVLRARARWDAPGKAPKLEARALAQQAIADDPDYAAAYAILGNTYNSAFITQWEGPEALESAYKAARKAVELDPQSSIAQELLGRVLLRRRQHDAAISSIQRAIALNPNESRHYAALADVLTFANRPREAIALMRKAMRLDPFFFPRYNMYLGRAYYFSKEYDKAAKELRTCAARAPKWRPCYMFLVAAYAEMGRKDDASRAKATLLKISPRFSISGSVEKHLPLVPAAMRFYVGGLKKAAVPE